MWQRAMDLVIEVYAATKPFPHDERYGPTSQTRRAASSIALNIAEGAGCRSRKEFAQFLSIALRSQYELATALRIAVRLDYLSGSLFAELDERTANVGRPLQGLLDSVSRDPATLKDASLDTEFETDFITVSALLTEMDQ